ncbi:MAG TPA: FG-GAP-like repeat-containing protein, partial [Pyrinomonadaceae bacterium]|nr:FG-GAP-like repeat-containing protein [Pyrinomonadaceae bacterium]
MWFYRCVNCAFVASLVLAFGVGIANGTGWAAPHNFNEESDNLFAYSSSLRASDGRFQDYFGSSIAVDGDTAVVGASGVDVGPGAFDHGAVYVFVRRGTGWSFQQKLTASDAATSDGFGSRVAIDGDTIVASSYLDDSGTAANRGAVYVFTRTGSIWTEQQKLLASDGAGADWFGYSVAISGDTILAGAPNDDFSSLDNAGSAYVFTRSGQTWSEQSKIVASDPTGFSMFGSSVAIDGNNALIGSPDSENGGSFRHGSAYVIVRDGATWSHQQKLTPASIEPFDSLNFGITVDIDGETCVIGASEESTASGSDAGAVYVFTRTGSTWTRQAKLLASDATSYDGFGKDVSIEGNQILIGSPTNDVINSEQGVAYLFLRTGTVWAEQQQLIAADGGFSDYFGENVAMSDGMVLVAAAADDIGSVSDVGSVYTFLDNNAPDLQPASDSGISSSDDITNRRDLTFVISDVTPGAVVELLRDGAPVASTTVGGTSVSLSDFNVPTNTNLHYVARQTLPSNTVLITAPKVVTIDTLGPAATINQTVDQPDPTRFQPLTFATAFNDIVYGLEGGDISLVSSTANVSNATVSIVGNGPFTAYVVGAISNGQAVVATVPADVVTDDAGNGNMASVSVDNSVTLDNVAPSVTINQAADQLDPTSTPSIRFTASFSESVGGLAPADISFSGSTTDTTGLNVTISGGPVIYTISVGGLRSSGQLRVSLPAGTVQDVLGNPNTASTSTDDTVTFIKRTAQYDFDGDGKADIGIFRPSNGQWWINRSSSGQTTVGTFGASTDLITPADFTGDGKTDIAFYRPSNGVWFILRSEDFSYFSLPFGTTGDVPVPGDFDGDGKADLTVFRPSTSAWYIRRSSDGGTTIQGFGSSSDIPVPADYDGDGRTDIAIYRPSNGQWWVQRSTAGVMVLTFGTATDKPVQGDYTGDGKTDIAFFRPSTGVWSILRSEDFSYYSLPFGAVGDSPAPGDYDGDGKFDPTVFRPDAGTWYSQRAASTVIQQFGSPGDRPLA